MRRFLSGSLFVTAILALTISWSACGGGSSNSQYAITSFTFAPTLISLEPGEVLEVSATPYNSAGTVVTATVTYTSSDPVHADITEGGALCAGQWDQTQTLCSPNPPTNPQLGTFTITATANGATGTTTAYIHAHVDAVYLHPPSAACTSMGKTAGVTAYACAAPASGSSCSATCPDNANLCDISSTVGGFNFGVVDSSVASIDSTGKLTAGIPGSTKLYASVSSGNTSTTSTAVPYTTCLVDSISLHVQGKTDTNFTVANGSSTTLQADVLDTAGASIQPTLSYNTTSGAVGTSASSSSGTGSYVAKAPGYGGVVASCTPPNCNKNASAIFSNVDTSTVTSSGTNTVTANDTNIYVTGVGAEQMFPVDSTAFTLGTVIPLPYPPNSMMMSHDGTHIFLGGDTYGSVITTASNSVQILNFPGKVLAVAPNDAYVIFANTDTTTTPPTGSVDIMSGSSLTLANTGGFNIPNVSAASFTPDGNTVYFAAGSSLYRYRVVGDSGSTPIPLTLTPGGNPLPAAAADVKTSANGSIVFSSIPSITDIVTDETCNVPSGSLYLTGFEPLTTSAFKAPSTMAPLPNGTGMLAVDGTQLDEVTITNPNPLTAPFAGCPATGFATKPSTISLASLGSNFTVNQLAISNSGHYAAVFTGCATGTSCTPQVGIVDLTTGTLTAVPLVDKGTAALTQVYSGGWMLDDSGVWVGADDSYIHFISIASMADTEQVQVQIQGPSSGSTPVYVNPSLVAVQPK